MSCKSALYAINNSAVSLPDGGTYAPATIVRRYGQNYQLQGNGITLTGPGYYDIAAGATLSGSAAGTITLTAYPPGIKSHFIIFSAETMEVIRIVLYN